MRKKLMLWLAFYESSNFTFEGVGATEDEARASLHSALHLHCKRTGAILEEFYYPDDVYVRELAAGDMFIDKDKVTR